jgi:hypothetical protein
MTMTRVRFQFSLRIFLVVIAVASFGILKFTPQIRAAINRLTARGPDVAFSSNPTVATPGIWHSFQAMHDWYEKQFVESENGFGFRRVVQFDDPFIRKIEVNGRLYSTQRLELVSFRDRDTPVAFVNKHGNPARKTYKQADTRSLSEFERQALAKLRSGRQFIYNGDSERPQFVGALRAKASCLACHDVKQGELLGGFAYELNPAPALPQLIP